MFLPNMRAVLLTSFLISSCHFLTAANSNEEIARAELFERNRDQLDFDPYNYPQDYEPNNPYSTYYPYPENGQNPQNYTPRNYNPRR